jgi:hypothetical protein
MSSHGVGTYSINSFWESGSLIFYEKAVGHTATGDVFTIGTAAVKVGGTSQDIDFQWYGSSSKSAIIDNGAATFTLTGLTMSSTKPINLSGTYDYAAIDMQSLVPGTNAGGDQAGLIRAGTAGSKMLFATNYQQGCLFHLKTTGGRFTGLEMNVYTEDEEPTTARELRGIEVIARSLANDGGGADPMYAICGSVQILASRDAPAAGSKMVGGYFSYSVATTDNKSAAGMATCLYLETGSSKNMAQGDYAIYAIANNAAATPLTAFMAFYGGATSLIQFGPEMTPANGHAWEPSAGISAGTTAGGWLKLSCWTGAAFEERYINLVTGA